MYITCPKCGHRNDLGHLFCTKCSAKLDLSHVSEDIENEEKSQSVKAFFQLIIFVILLGVFVLGGLAGWPSNPFYKDSDDGVAGGIDSQLAALHLVAGRPEATITTAPPLSQKDVNAWLAGMEGKPKDVKSVSVLLKPDKVTLRVKRVVPSYSISVIATPNIPYTCDLVLKAVSNRLTVASGTIGHLPMPGPARQLVEKIIAPVFSGRAREKEIFGKISDVKVEDGKITVTVTGS